MSSYAFPSLEQDGWQETCTTIQRYSQVLGKIRRAMTPSRKHWWHISLQCAANGLYTTPMPDGATTFDLLLDLTRHELLLTTNQGGRWTKPLGDDSLQSFSGDVMAQLSSLGINVPLDLSLFEDETRLPYDPARAARLWLALSQVDSVFRRFRNSIHGETSPVQLWPHHFDLAVLWLTGNLVEGQDPQNEESADEQMNFGFVLGDESIAEPYFYVTAYPLPDGLTETALPAPGYWITEGFTGAILPYAALVGVEAPDQDLAGFLRTTYEAGYRMMVG